MSIDVAWLQVRVKNQEQGTLRAIKLKRQKEFSQWETKENANKSK